LVDGVIDSKVIFLGANGFQVYISKVQVQAFKFGLRMLLLS
jgi:hypothetical protein